MPSGVVRSEGSGIEMEVVVVDLDCESDGIRATAGLALKGWKKEVTEL